MKAEDVPNDYKLALAIDEFNQNNELVWFSKLVEKFEGQMAKASVSKYLDRLFDLGIIDGEWMQNEDNKWVRAFQVAGEAKPLLKSIRNSLS